jgi:hypothetical protein
MSQTVSRHACIITKNRSKNENFARRTMSVHINDVGLEDQFVSVGSYRLNLSKRGETGAWKRLTNGKNATVCINLRYCAFKITRAKKAIVRLENARKG